VSTVSPEDVAQDTIYAYPFHSILQLQCPFNIQDLTLSPPVSTSALLHHEYYEVENNPSGVVDLLLFLCANPPNSLRLTLLLCLDNVPILLPGPSDVGESVSEGIVSPFESNPNIPKGGSFHPPLEFVSDMLFLVIILNGGLVPLCEFWRDRGGRPEPFRRGGDEDVEVDEDVDTDNEVAGLGTLNMGTFDAGVKKNEPGLGEGGWDVESG